MSSTDRLATLVLQLQAPGWQTAAALGEQIGVSERTVYRDVQEIQAEQVPVEGAPGHGYRLRDGYVLPPIALTRDEAKVLLDKVAGIQQGARRDVWAAETARAKLAALVPASATERVRSDGRLALFTDAIAGRDPDHKRVTEAVTRAMREGRVLELDTGGGTFAPYAMLGGGSSLRVLGAISRTGRSFIGALGLADLASARLGEQTFTAPPAYRHHERPESFAESSSVTVRFDELGAEAAQNGDLPSGVEQIDWEESAGRNKRVAVIYTTQPDALIVWVLGFAGHAEVLEPATARASMRREVTRMATFYQLDAPTLF